MACNLKWSKRLKGQLAHFALFLFIKNTWCNTCYHHRNWNSLILSEWGSYKTQNFSWKSSNNYGKHKGISYWQWNLKILINEPESDSSGESLDTYAFPDSSDNYSVWCSVFSWRSFNIIKNGLWILVIY